MDPLSLLIQGGGAVGGLLGNLIGGQNAPSLQQLLELGQMREGNAYDQIALDPQAMNAALRSLSQMQSMAESGGMDPQSQLAQAQAMESANANEQAQRQAVLQQMAMRGQGGSGAELAGRLQATQTGANANAAAGMEAASGARQRALQAAAMGGQLGMGIRGQQFDEAARRAQSANAIHMFNASQRLNAGQIASGNAQQTTDRWSRVGAGAGQAAGAAAGYAWNPEANKKKSSLLPGNSYGVPAGGIS